VEPLGFDRLYIAPASEGEMAVAPVGVDEVRLVPDLIAAVQRRAAVDELTVGPVVLALDVGVVRVVGDGFAGVGLARTWGLAGHPAVLGHVAAAARRAPDGTVPLAAVMPAPLFAELCVEGLDRRGWSEVAAAAAWVRWCGVPGPNRARTWTNEGDLTGGNR
jgi:hypothetical protein